MNYPIALLIGLLGTSVIHASKGIMKLGILRIRAAGVEGRSKRRASLLYGAGIAANFTAPFWVMVANLFGPTVLYTSMYGAGLVALLLFSRFILHEHLTRRHVLGAAVIMAGTGVLGYGEVTCASPAPSQERTLREGGWWMRHVIFERHFADFCEQYDKKYAVIEDPDELKRILRNPGCRAEQQPQAATRRIKIGLSPPGFDFLRYALRETCIRFAVAFADNFSCKLDPLHYHARRNRSTSRDRASLRQRLPHCSHRHEAQTPRTDLCKAIIYPMA